MGSCGGVDASAGGGNIVNQVKNVYDGFGDLTKQYQQHGSAVDTSSTLATTYTYNTANTSTFGNRLASVTYPGGDAIDYNYTVSGTASLDSVISRLDSMSESGTTLESYTYMGLSTVVEEDHPEDGVNLTYLGTASGDAGDTVVGLDRFGRVVDEKWTTGTDGGAGTVKDEYQYTYDEDGNVTSKVNVLDSSFTENYTYDNLARLTAVSRGTDSSYQSFSMNSIGDINSITTDGTTSNRTTNSENQITAIDGNAITYDNNGNVTTDDHGDTLEYDAWNRLVAVYNSDGALIAGYTYDGYGRITSETNITTTTDFYYSGTQEIEERTGVTDYTGASLSSNGTTTLVNVYSPDYVNDVLLRDSYSGGSFSSREYFTHDANYDVTAVISTAGGVLQRQVYDPYGAVAFYSSSWVVQSGDTLNLQRLWQGGWQDGSTGYYHFEGRWDSVTMGWISWDPDDYPDGPSAYLEDGDSPIDLVDPTGTTATNVDPNWKLDWQVLQYNLKVFDEAFEDAELDWDTTGRRCPCQEAEADANAAERMLVEAQRRADYHADVASGARPALGGSVSYNLGASAYWKDEVTRLTKFISQVVADAAADGCKLVLAPAGAGGGGMPGVAGGLPGIPGGTPTFPGNDPAQAPPGTEWRGQPGSTPGDGNGNYYNPSTGESYRPDLNHSEPIGPHWDYRAPDGTWYRIMPDGTAVPK